jgi:wyosine [tRNA(Phe)-imidazoG37] synthetase (radical SAM superfamily)
MSVLELQRDVVYGPIQSRRLGLSLGVNLLPATRKTCTFDCVYCQYGQAAPQPGSGGPAEFADTERVVQRVEQVLGQGQRLDYITFSGNGEPTLHPHFPEMVDAVRRVRDRMRPHVRLAILSNSSQILRPEIREAIEYLDDPIMKLDAGDSETLTQINHPGPGVQFEDIIAGLCVMPRVVIQSMLMAGQVQNVEGEVHERWLNAVAQVSPEKVQIYTVDRPVATAGVRRVSRRTLEILARRATESTGIEVQAF